MRRLNPTYVLPVLCLGASVTALAWVIVSGAGVEPVFRLGVSLSLMLTFGLVWIFGIRYPDVGWMVVVASLLALGTMATPNGTPGRWDLLFVGTERFALMLALTSFLLAFFRAQIRTGLLEIAFGVAVCLFVAVDLVLSPETSRQLGMNGPLQSYLGAVLLGYAAVHGFAKLAPLPPKRQRYVALVVGATVVALAAYLLSARIRPAAGAFLATPLIDFTLAAVLATFLLADLVIFHRHYFKAKTSRVAKPHAELGVEARLELGRGVRGLLPQGALAGRFGEFEREFVVREARVLGGDWQFVWESAGELRLLFGDVAGKGPQVSLGVLAIRCFLAEAQRQGMALDQALRYLNTRLLEVFERQLTSTAAVVSLGLDGSVELFNCGGTGFFTVTTEGGRHWPLNSTPLGVSSDLEIGYSAVPLDHLHILFAATDGFVAGQAGTRRLIDFFDEALDLSLTLPAVRDRVVSLARADGEGDDRTLLIIQRRFADAEGHAS